MIAVMEYIVMVKTITLVSGKDEENIPIYVISWRVHAFFVLSSERKLFAVAWLQPNLFDDLDSTALVSINWFRVLDESLGSP